MNHLLRNLFAGSILQNEPPIIKSFALKNTNKILATLFALCLALLLAIPAYAQRDDSEINLIITSAESLFTRLKEKDHKAVWGLLTEKSKETIADDTYKGVSKSGGKYSRDDITSDFSRGGPLAEAYWQGYLATFDPDSVLRQSVWRMGMLKKDRAEIILTYKKSEKPAELKMFKEKGRWKVGLVETFWSRK